MLHLSNTDDRFICKLIPNLDCIIPKFAGLKRTFELPVEFIDETLTTDFADAIIRETTAPGRRITTRRKSVRDQLAAELILKSYLHDGTTPRTR